MTVKMREMETRELEAQYNFEAVRMKLANDAEKANREFALKESEAEGAKGREEKFDAALGTVLQAVGTMAQGMDIVVKGQQQLAEIMMAPRVLVNDPVTGKPVAAKPDFSGAI